MASQERRSAIPPPEGLVPLDFVGQFITVIGLGREVARQSVARHYDPRHDGFREMTLAQSLADRRSNFAPEGVATFFVDSIVAHNGELIVTGRKVKQNRIAVTSGRHAELFKPGRRALDNIIIAEVPARYKDPNLAGCLTLGVLDGLDDFAVVQFLKKIAGLHFVLPSPACSAASKAPTSSSEAASSARASAAAAPAASDGWCPHRTSARRAIVGAASHGASICGYEDRKDKNE